MRQILGSNVRDYSLIAAYSQLGYHAPPIEGKVEGAIQALDVGDRGLVKFIFIDPWRGYIDFNLIERH